MKPTLNDEIILGKNDVDIECIQRSIRAKEGAQATNPTNPNNISSKVVCLKLSTVTSQMTTTLEFSSPNLGF